MQPRLEDSSLLNVDDILDWAGFCSKLREAGGNGLPSPATRIMKLLPPEVREMFSVLAQTNYAEQAHKHKFVAALNEILKLRDFSQAPEFEKLAVNDEARKLLSNLMELSDEAVERLNRLLLEASYPQEIAKSQIQPYVGPRSFQKEQRNFFFGRDQEADELVALITAHPAVLFYSQSGAGKTSLLNAQLIPKLEEEEHFSVIPPMRVQGQIPATFRVGKNVNIFVLNALSGSSRYEPNRSTGGMTLADFLRGRKQGTNQYGEPSPTVVIFDQFEELFTSYPGRWEDRQTFFEQVRDALEGNPKTGLKGDPLLRVVFCMREDYIAELDPYLSLLPEKLRTRFRLEHLREKSALLAITKPLEGTNRSYARGVAEQLVKNLLKMPTQSVTGTQTLGLYVEPVQLQVVCQSLWDALTPEETVITQKHLDKYGDVSQALSNFYERSIKSVAQETDVKEEVLRSWFGDTLITSEGARAPVYRGQIQTGGMPNAAVDKLEGMRLIKGEWKGTNVRWYELAHDRFIEPIRKSNDKWLAEQSRGEQIRLRLENKASKWEPGSSVLEVDELLEAQRLVKANNASKFLRALVDASQTSAQRKRVILYRWGTIGLSILVLLLGSLALYAWYQRRAAREAEGKAKSRLLATKASMYLETDPELSVLLAKEAMDHFWDTEEAQQVIRSGLLSLSNVRGALRGHTKRVTGAEYSPDGKYVLTTSDDGTARLWDASTKNTVQELRAEQGVITYSTFSPDGKLIVTTASDGTARVWDGNTGQLQRELRHHTDSVARAAFSPDSIFIVTVGEDKTVCLWKTSSGELIRQLTGHSGLVNGVAFSPDKTHFATESDDGTGRIWNVNNTDSIELSGLTGPNAAIAFSPDGKLLATEGGPDTEGGVNLLGDYPVTVWDVGTGKVKFTISGHEQAITGITFSPNGRFIVTTSGDSTGRVWGNGDGRLISVLRGHTGSVSRAVFSLDGRFIVTASRDNTARVWDAQTFQSLATLRGHSLPVNGAAFSPDTKLLVTASDDKTARIWGFGLGPERNGVAVLSGHASPVNSGAFSPDGNYVVTASDGVSLWQVSSDGLRRVALLGGLSQRFSDAVFSPDGRFIATAGEDNTAQIWDSASQGVTRKSERLMQGHAGTVNSIAYSPDGNFLVTASSDTTARVWNTSTGAAVAELRGHTKKVNSAAFSPDGKSIVTAGDDATVRIWDTGTYKPVRILGSQTSVVRRAQYSPDGNLIVTASADGVARVWNLNTGQAVELRGHADEVNSAAFSADSKLIVTASADKTARVWDAHNGQSITAMRGHTGKVLNAVFSRDSRFVLTASEDYTARIYPPEAFATFKELKDLIHDRVMRDLTPDERRYFLEEPQGN